MTLSVLDNALWAAGLLGHAALLGVLLLRKRWRLLPVFTLFVAFQVARTCLLFLVLKYGSGHQYFLSYWMTGFLDYVFQLGLIFELAGIALRPTGTWIRDAHTAFIAWSAVGLVLAAGFGMLLHPSELRGLDLWDLRVTVFTSMLTCEVFLSMSFAANRLGLRQGRYEVAIGQGLGFWALISLLEQFAHGILGWDRPFDLFTHLRMGLYIVILVYWIRVLWRPQPQQAPPSPEMQRYLVALHAQVQYDLDTFKH